MCQPVCAHSADGWPVQVDPLVSLMKVEKVPDSTYDMVGGLDQQIKEIKEVRRPAHLGIEPLPPSADLAWCCRSPRDLPTHSPALALAVSHWCLHPLTGPARAGH